MSARNKSGAKAIRREARQTRPVHPVVPNGPALSEDFAIITDPKAKISAAHRKSIMRERSSSVIMPEAVGPTRREKVEAKLARLTMAQLVRRVHQFTVRAAGCQHKIEALSEGSRFLLPLQNAHRINVVMFQMATAEINARISMKLKS